MPRSTQSPDIGLLTIDEACGRLGVCSKTIYRMFRRGQLKRWTHWGRTAVSTAEVDQLKRRGRA